MVSTFLHEDQDASPDEAFQTQPQICDCGEEMWMISVATVVSDQGVQATYKYECKYCGRVREVKRNSEKLDAFPIAPAV